MTGFRAAVFDIDGTLAMMDKNAGTFTALPGAVDAIAACRDRGMEVAAYTNGTFFPPAHYAPLLAAAGIDIPADRILTPAAVAASRLSAMGLRRVMVVGGEGTRVPAEDAGLEVIAPTAQAGPVDAVLLGYTRDFNAGVLEAAVQAVWDGAKPFAGSAAPYFAGATGRILGISGALAAAVTHATGEAVTVFGKPEVAGLSMVADMTGAAPGEMLVIGDDPTLELLMARRAGAFALGVTTGARDAAAFAAMPEGERAHLVLPTLVGLADQPFMEGPDG